MLLTHCVLCILIVKFRLIRATNYNAKDIKPKDVKYTLKTPENLVDYKINFGNEDERDKVIYVARMPEEEHKKQPHTKVHSRVRKNGKLYLKVDPCKKRFGSKYGGRIQMELCEKQKMGLTFFVDNNSGKLISTNKVLPTSRSHRDRNEYYTYFNYKSPKTKHYTIKPLESGYYGDSEDKYNSRTGFNNFVYIYKPKVNFFPKKYIRQTEESKIYRIKPFKGAKDLNKNKLKPSAVNSHAAVKKKSLRELDDDEKEDELRRRIEKYSDESSGSQERKYSDTDSSKEYDVVTTQKPKKFYIPKHIYETINEKITNKIFDKIREFKPKRFQIIDRDGQIQYNNAYIENSIEDPGREQHGRDEEEPDMSPETFKSAETDKSHESIELEGSNSASEEKGQLKPKKTTLYYYAQSPSRLLKQNEYNMRFRKNSEFRLPTFLPKRQHWNAGDIGRLGYYWYSGYHGKYHI